MPRQGGSGIAESAAGPATFGALERDPFGDYKGWCPKTSRLADVIIS